MKESFEQNGTFWGQLVILGIMRRPVCSCQELSVLPESCWLTCSHLLSSKSLTGAPCSCNQDSPLLILLQPLGALIRLPGLPGILFQCELTLYALVKLPESSTDYVRMFLNPVLFFSECFLLSVFKSLCHLLVLGSWAGYLTFLMSQFPLYSEDDCTPFLIVLAGVNEIIYEKH